MIGFAEVKEAMRGRELDFLSQYLNSKQLNGKNQPCPNCGGKDRYRHVKKTNGGFYCSTFDKGTGDVFDHVAHTQSMPMPDVLRAAKLFLGMENPTQSDIKKANELRAKRLAKAEKLKATKADRVFIGAAMDNLYSEISHTKGETDEAEIEAARHLMKALMQVYGKNSE